MNLKSVFPTIFRSVSTLIFSHRSNSCSTEISQQNKTKQIFVQIVYKKGEDSLCKISHEECFRTNIFDRFYQGMGRRHVFQIPLQNSEFQLICNRQFLVVCFYISSTLICEKILLLSCLDKEGKCLSKDGKWKSVCLEEKVARSRQFNAMWQAATPEPNVSRGAFNKTFQSF